MSSIPLPPPIANSNALKLTPMSTDTDEGVFLSLQGIEGSGKTRFAFSAPGPILYLNLDGENWKRVRKHFTGKEIFKEDFEIPPIPDGQSTDFVQSMVLPLWMRLKNITAQALSDGSIRTIVMDKGTTAWALARLAHLGKIKGVKSQHYDEVNADFNSYLSRMSNTKKISIVIHAEGDEYVDNVRTGRLKRDGFKYTGDRMKDFVRCFREEGKFYSQVMLSKTRPELDNKIFRDANNTFVDLVTAMYPESQITDWL